MIQFIVGLRLFISHFEKQKWGKGELSWFSQQNLTFKHSWDMETSLEEEESKRFKDSDV